VLVFVSLKTVPAPPKVNPYKFPEPSKVNRPRGKVGATPELTKV
jgi:hypothetical protein